MCEVWIVCPNCAAGAHDLCTLCGCRCWKKGFNYGTDATDPSSSAIASPGIRAEAHQGAGKNAEPSVAKKKGRLK